MLELLIATQNQGKIREIARLFESCGLEAKLFYLGDLGITVDCPETGKTFQENAIQKAVFYSNLKNDLLTVGDDSGLWVDALGGAPGVHSARYAGEPKNDDNNTQKLLRELKNAKHRKARFITVAALAQKGEVIETFEGEVVGEIIHQRRGDGGFGYDPVFFYPPEQKTFAQLTTEEKNRFSHRARAFQNLIKYFQNR